FFFFSSRRRHTRFSRDWSSDVCSSDLATDEYVIGTPLFQKMTLSLQNGNKITIEAPENSHENRYIQKVFLNGEPYSKNFFSHKELMEGAEIKFEMGSSPNKTRGIKKDDVPYSLSTN